MNNSEIKRVIKISVLLIVIAVGFALLSAKINGGSIFKSDKEVSVLTGKGNIDAVKEFDMSPINKISVDTVSSDVNIILSKDNNIKVHFYGTASEMSKAPTLEAMLNGDKLNISIKYPKQIMSIVNFNLSTNLDVYIPENYKKSIDIETVSGEVSMDELQADVLKVYTVSGDVDINSIVASTTDFGSVSGSIDIKAISSKSNGFETTSGDVKIDSITGDIKANSVSGSITAIYKEFNNDIQAETVSGDVKLSLPQDSAFNIDFSTMSGDLDNEFPLVVTGKIEKRNVKGTVGNGQKTIRVETVSGDAALNKK
jgi:lia operon protein LiaG